MKRLAAIDIGLLAVTTFCAVALVAASSISMPRPAAPARAVQRTTAITDAAALQEFAMGGSGAGVHHLADAHPSAGSSAAKAEAPTHDHMRGNHAATGAGSRTGASHAHDMDGDEAAAAPHDSHADGQGAPHGHGGDEDADDHGEEGPSDGTVVLAESNGQRVQYEPATDDRGAAIRFVNENAPPDDHHGAHGECDPTPEQQAWADRFLVDTEVALTRYDDKPHQVFADGFIAYPIFGNRFFHVINPERNEDEHVLVPQHLESFMYALTNDGWRALGGMYVMPKSYKDQPAEALPNPSGCLLQWHKHEGTVEGSATSFDPNKPQQSVWMAHVWTFADVDPWRDYDGTTWSPHTPFAPVPSVCRKDCI